MSKWIMHDVSNIGRWHMITNGVPLDTYAFAPSVAADAPFVFLGRVEEIKRPHLAIEIAKQTNARLVIAGTVPIEKRDWFDLQIAPLIDGSQITFIGPVDDAQKSPQQ